MGQQMKNAEVIACARQILQEGWFLRHTIIRWRGRLPKHLSAEADRHPAWSGLLSMPIEYRRIFRRLEKQLNAALQEHVYLTYWGNFITPASAISWQQRQLSIKQEFEDTRDRLVSQYESLRKRSDEVGELIGTIVWRRLHPESGDPPLPLLTEWGERVWKSVPQKADLLDKFSCKQIEYRLLRDLDPEECALFVEELSNEFYRRLTDLCHGIVRERTLYNVLSVDQRLIFLRQLDRLIGLWCLPYRPVKPALERIRIALEDSQLDLAVDTVNRLAEDVVPRFTEKSWRWVIEGD